jgi:hypothetical protein
MPSLPIADWLSELSRIETAIGAAVSDLDRYQSEGAAALADPRPAADPAAGNDRNARLEDRLRGWDARLTAAVELAASVERQLDEPAAAVVRWQQMFAGWRDLIKQGATPQPAAS